MSSSTALTVGPNLPSLPRDNSPVDSSIPKKAAKTRQEQRAEKVKTTRTAGTVGLGIAAALGAAFSGGLNTGFERVGKTAESISNIISVPFSILFPFLTLKNEYSNLKGDSKTGDDQIFNRMVYACASLGFAPQTFAEPILSFTKGTLNKVVTVANLPHILFTLFTYTGGRAMGALTAAKRIFNKDKSQEYRLEQEFNSLYKLGNLGSAQASVTAMSDNFCEGWGAIGEIAKGDFGSAFERFKDKPISVFLGTFLNSWIFPFEWAAKFFDTSIRCAENLDNFKNAIGHDSFITKRLEDLKSFWVNNSKNRDSVLGNFLYYGREFAKAESLIGPPIGMFTVVSTACNKFFKGDLFNKEAQEIGGAIGLFDKITSTVAFFGHSFYTSLYGITIRLPQTITTSTFYLTHLYNKMKGHKQGDEKYVDPIDIRDKIFNKSFINKISEIAEKRLNTIEKELHGDAANIVDPETKKSKFIRDFSEIMAQEVCYEPIREQHYAKFMEENNGIPPKDANKWHEYLLKNEVTMSEEFEPLFEKYLRESPQFTDAQINYMKSDKGKQDWDKIISLAKASLKKEIEHSKKDPAETAVKAEKKAEKTTHNKIELPDTFWGLLTNPKALYEVAKLRSFHVVNSVLPLFVKGFVNVVDFGRRDEEFWYRNFKAQETGIREGDYAQATDREACPVFMLNYQNAGKGLAKLYNGVQRIFSLAA